MKQIIALGGGGFSMEPDNPLLDRYILKQSGKKRPKVCFIGTASGDAEGYIERFYRAFEQHDCEPAHLSLFRPPTLDLESFVLEQHVIYVGGGNTKNLLALWREWKLDRILRTAWDRGIVLSGVSAGALCWFQEGLTDSYGAQLATIECLGFLPGSHCPHYDGEVERRPAFHRLLTSGEVGDGLAADDGAGLHFIGTDLHAVLSSRPNSKAYRLRLQAGRAVEEELTPTYLGDPD